MASVLNVFKIKEFDLKPIYEDWTDAPIFNGNHKKDMPVDQWLEAIREGCVARKVPEEYWYEVAQHYMGENARGRLDELKQVVYKVHGGKYRWSWKKFVVAMQNMGWTIDRDTKETIKVSSKGSSMWFTRKRATEAEPPAASTSTIPTTLSAPPSPKPSLSRTNTFLFGTSKKNVVEEPEEIGLPPVPPKRQPSRRGRAATVAASEVPPVPSSGGSGFWPIRASKGKDTNSDASSTITTSTSRPIPKNARSETTIGTVARRSKSKGKSPARSEASTESGHGEGQVTTVAQAPVWLLNACNALEYITNEHPKAMSIMSAILITIGSIPAIPAIAAGAGGAVLASSTAHAVGAIAVGLGQALGATVVKKGGKSDGGSEHGSDDSASHKASGHGGSRVR